MSRLMGVLVVLVAVSGLWTISGPAAPARAANNSEQVVFSGTGSGTFGSFGFWIWCEAESRNPYVGECNGAMYIYARQLTRHVDGTIAENPPDSGLYTITVASRDGQVACTLNNIAPAQRGPHNSVMVTCSMPSGSGASTTAVVNVTGP